MIVIYDGLGANEEESPSWGQDSEDRNQRTTIFLICFSTLSFVSILELFSIQSLLLSSFTIIVLLLK